MKQILGLTILPLLMCLFVLVACEQQTTSSEITPDTSMEQPENVPTLPSEAEQLEPPPVVEQPEPEPPLAIMEQPEPELAAEQIKVPPYTIVERQDVSFSTARRLVYRIQLPDNYTQDEAMVIANSIVETNHSAGNDAVNAVGFFFYFPGSDPYNTADGSIDWAPNGEWRDAIEVETGDYSTFRFNVVFYYTDGNTLNNIVDPPVPVVPEPIADDHGNNCILDDTMINLNSVTNGSIEVEGDIDTFRVEVEELGTLTIFTEGNTDTYGSVGMPFGIAISDDDSGDGFNFRIELEVFLPDSTYCINVEYFGHSGIGDYKLNVLFSDEPTALDRTALSNIDFDKDEFEFKGLEQFLRSSWEEAGFNLDTLTNSEIMVFQALSVALLEEARNGIAAFTDTDWELAKLLGNYVDTMAYNGVTVCIRDTDVGPDEGLVTELNRTSTLAYFDALIAATNNWFAQL